LRRVGVVEEGGVVEREEEGVGVGVVGVVGVGVAVGVGVVGVGVADVDVEAFDASSSLDSSSMPAGHQDSTRPHCGRTSYLDSWWGYERISGLLITQSGELPRNVVLLLVLASSLALVVWVGSRGVW